MPRSASLPVPVLLAALVPGLLCGPARHGAAEGDAFLDYEIRLETVMKHDDGQFLWYHPRVAAVPGRGLDGGPAVVMTLQKHLQVSDYYSGLSVMRTDDLCKTWTEPDPRPELDWRREDGGVVIAVADVTPGRHGPTGKVIAVGAQVRYSPAGEQPRTRPAPTRRPMRCWIRPQELDALAGASDASRRQVQLRPQRLRAVDRRARRHRLTALLLRPLCKRPGVRHRRALQLRWQRASLPEHGDEMVLNVERGLCEPRSRSPAVGTTSPSGMMSWAT